MMASHHVSIIKWLRTDIVILPFYRLLVTSLKYFSAVARLRWCLVIPEASIITTSPFEAMHKQQYTSKNLRIAHARG